MFFFKFKNVKIAYAYGIIKIYRAAFHDTATKSILY